MKYFIFVISLLYISVSCVSKHEVKISVANSSDIDLSDQIVEIPIVDISSKLILGDTSKTYIVKDDEGTQIPSQTTYNNKLIFQINIDANEAKNYNITIGKKQKFEPKVFGRFYPERKGDFAWENDKVGFRFYGDSLRYTDGPSNALDLWLKRTDKLVLNKWYHNDLVEKISYHLDHGEGCDPYAVGRTLGAGNIAPYVRDSLFLNNNFLSYQLLDEGSLRITFKLSYPSIKIDGKDISEDKIISLDAGSQMTKIEQKFGFTKPTPVAVGIVKRQSGDSIIVSRQSGTLVYQEPPMGENGQLFVGVIIPSGIVKDTLYTYQYTNPVNKNTGTFTNILAVSEYNPDKQFIYYTGFGWSKFGFENVAAFDKYIQNYDLKLKNPLTIQIQ